MVPLQKGNGDSMNRKSRRDDAMNETFSVEEVRQIFGVGASTVRRRIKDGDIPTIEGLGRIKRIPRWWVDHQLKRPVGSSQ